MKDHYQLNDVEYENLLSQGITVADMYKAISDFSAQETPVGMIHLMWYIDRFGGSWVDGVYKRKTDRIAEAVFNCLDIPRKIQVAEYASEIS